MSSDETKIIEELLLTVKQLERKIDTLQTQLNNLTAHKPSEEWLTMEELIRYLPTHPSESTIRRMIAAREFPTYKAGKRIAVKKAEIDEWLLSSRKKSAREINATATNHIDSRKSVRPAPWRQTSRPNIPSIS